MTSTPGGVAERGGQMVDGRGLVMRPDSKHSGASGGRTIGAVQVTVGREDGGGAFFAGAAGAGAGGEVKTTGWVVVSFTPRPTGLR